MRKNLFIFYSVILLFFSSVINAQIAYGLNSGYKYLKGKDAATLSSSWNTPDFDDSGWSSGPAPFRYGDGAGGTLLDDMQFSYSTIYLRGSFNVINASFIEEITLNADFDDGFILWINGVITQSENAPEIPTDSSFSSGQRESGSLNTYIIQTSGLNLTEGINTLAVQCFNTSLESSDLYFDMSMSAEPDIPVPVLPRITQKPVFSHAGGFYSIPFTLTITSPLPQYNIAYTLDGSNPENSPSRILAGINANVVIDPLSSSGRPLTPGVVVRAALIGTDINPSFPEGRTYIFTSEVSNQNAPGGIWPSSDINGQVIDLPMDPNVINDSRYSNLMDFSLKAIPTFSIITDIKNLFDPVTGIYVNAGGHGDEWERESSVELLNPDGSDGFRINAGLRIRGGWSRHNNYPKHAFRLFFNSEYGSSKLDYPLFGDDGTSRFDKIDLRCEQNYSWANGWDGYHNTAVREVFSRDTQRDMKQPYSRSRYYHLYLNGMYWGLYQTQERTEANFASSYLGGTDVDFDVVKVNTEGWSYRIEATDGSLTTWQNIYNSCFTGFAANSAYFKLEGRDLNGNKIEGAPVLVDIDNLIDYMLVIFYTGNFDSPTSSFGNNKGANNFFAIYNNNLKNQGFTFYAHDAEHSMMSEFVSPGTGLYEDRVNLARRQGAAMNVSDFSQFHPQWLHEKLTQNAEYRIRFADRSYIYLRSGNVLSKEACLERFNTRASQIDDAIIAESARWGDSNNSFPARTKDDSWIPELNRVRTDFIPFRSSILIDQLKEADLYPSLMPPAIMAGGTSVLTENIPMQNSATIAFQNPNSSGVIYYTLDGSDPRLVGGAINASAIKWVSGSDFILNHSATIKTRVIEAGIWSAMNYTNLLNTNEDYSKLKVTELMYHPMDVINGTDTIFGSSLEFIEFKNTGNTSINISGMILDSAVHCVFPANTLLGPQKFYVAASKPDAFTDFYGFSPSANFSGNFSNGGEYVMLTDPLGNNVISFTYNDADPWPVEPDGAGFSLNSVEINPLGDPNNYLYWRSSNYNNGTPLSDDFADSIENPDEEILMNIYPNPTSDILNIDIQPEINQENLTVKIYNLDGSVMYSNELTQENSIHLKEYGIGPGVYIIRVEGKKLMQTRKLVVTW